MSVLAWCEVFQQILQREDSKDRQISAPLHPSMTRMKSRRVGGGATGRLIALWAASSSNIRDSDESCEYFRLLYELDISGLTPSDGTEQQKPAIGF